MDQIRTQHDAQRVKDWDPASYAINAWETHRTPALLSQYLRCNLAMLSSWDGQKIIDELSMSMQVPSIPVLVADPEMAGFLAQTDVKA
jgi:hypothetical protein